MLARKLWRAHQDLAQVCLHHPFVTHLAQGLLSSQQFAYYVGQDAFFLQAFARAYSIAAVKVADWQGFRTFHGLVGGVLTELQLHEDYANTWAVNLQEIQPGPATRRYTDFLLATAWNYDAGLTTVAMAPCMRLYAFLGQQVANQGTPDHQYADWVHTYSSPEFEQLAVQLENLIERYADDSPLAFETYRYALECEVDFFQAAWEVEMQQ